MAAAAAAAASKAADMPQLGRPLPPPQSQPQFPLSPPPPPPPQHHRPSLHSHHNHSQNNHNPIRKLVGRLRTNSHKARASLAPSSPQWSSGSNSSPPLPSASSSSAVAEDADGAPHSRTASIIRASRRLSSSPSSPRASDALSPPPRETPEASIALELWDEAYDSLRDNPSTAGLVLVYEAVISQELPDRLKTGGLNDSSLAGKDAVGRLELLRVITSVGLRKRRESRASHIQLLLLQQQTEDVARQVLDEARARIESVVAEYPAAAAVAWAGFCTLTPLLLEPMLQRADLRRALAHVVGRIPWYMGLAALLHSPNWAATPSPSWSFQAQRVRARESLAHLYRGVLELEMNCVCAAASAWNPAAKNVVGWAGLGGLATAIKDADNRARRLAERSLGEATRVRLRHLDVGLPCSGRAGGDDGGEPRFGTQAAEGGGPVRQPPSQAAQAAA